jgi:hypothetical protein
VRRRYAEHWTLSLAAGLAASLVAVIGLRAIASLFGIDLSGLLGWRAVALLTAIFFTIRVLIPGSLDALDRVFLAISAARRSASSAGYESIRGKGYNRPPQSRFAASRRSAGFYRLRGPGVETADRA